jgi:hypothetical protein
LLQFSSPKQFKKELRVASFLIPKKEFKTESGVASILIPKTIQNGIKGCFISHPQKFSYIRR